MREIFKGYYTPTDEEFRILWTEGIFIFDTNVLLNLYRLSKETRDEFVEVIEKLGGRVWIPYHVALEFQRNRVDEISTQKTRFNDVINIVNKTYSYADNELDKLQLRKRHSIIDPDKFLNKIKDSADKFVMELKELESSQPSVFENDNIRDKIDNIFKGKIGNPPKDQTEVDKITSEANKRYNNNIPPGYKDSKKGGQSFSHNSLTYENRVGDLIVWKQIIHFSKSEGINNIVFITDDNKDDWWWICKEGGKKTLGPRPELISEIKAESNIDNIYFYTSERFLKYSTDYIGAVVSDKSINQVRDVSKLRSKNSISLVKTILNTLKKLGNSYFKHINKQVTLSGFLLSYINSTHPDVMIRKNHSFFDDESGSEYSIDLLLETKDEEVILEAKSLTSHISLSEAVDKLFSLMKVSGITEGILYMPNLANNNSFEFGSVTKKLEGKNYNIYQVYSMG